MGFEFDAAPWEEVGEAEERPGKVARVSLAEKSAAAAASRQQVDGVKVQ